MPPLVRRTRRRCAAPLSRRAAWWPTARARGGGTRRARPSPACPFDTTARPLWCTSSMSVGGLLLGVAEQLLEHEHDVRHEVDRVVPHEHDPRPVGRDVGVATSVRRPRPVPTDASSGPSWPRFSPLARRRPATSRWRRHLAPHLRSPPYGRRQSSSRARLAWRPARCSATASRRRRAPHEGRRLRRAHQAADHRAAARHDGADDDPGRAGPPVALADRSPRWSAARWPPAAPTPSTCTSTATSTALMPRTQDRPLVTGVRHAAGRARPSPSSSRWWRSPCCGACVNLLTAVLALSATLFYVFVYTLWLKRTSTQQHRDRRRRRRRAGAGRAGPRSPTRSAGRPVVLFAVIFFWTPPHFWALAIRYADDYRAADVPMLPAVASIEVTSRRDARLHAWCCGSLSLVLVPVGRPRARSTAWRPLVLGAGVHQRRAWPCAGTRARRWRCGSSPSRSPT